MLVLAVLEKKKPGQRWRQRHLPAVFAYGASQTADRVVLLASGDVIPAFDGRDREADIASVHRMRPSLGGKRFKGRLQFSMRRR
jgi:hypothetical protein